MTNFQRTEGFEVPSAEARQIQVRETVSVDMQHDAQKHLLNGEAPSGRANSGLTQLETTPRLRPPIWPPCSKTLPIPRAPASSSSASSFF